jgi:hypothetical protein
MVQVCGFPLDVESEITDEHRAARYNAWYYIGHAVERMEIGDLSSSFSAETLEACGTKATEWGGVRGAVSQLIARYGTDAEMEAQLDQMSAPELFCQAAPRIESLTRYQDICERRYPTLEER